MILNRRKLKGNSMKKITTPTALIVFGATGDLTQNKLYPALYLLAEKNLLPHKFYLYGVAHEQMTEAAFKKDITDDLRRHFGKKLKKKTLDLLLQQVRYFAADLTDLKAYTMIEDQIKRDESKSKKAIQRLFYLALPPLLFSKVVANVNACKLGKQLCTKEHVLSRIIVEKPFGYNLKTANELDNQLQLTFDERQVYRIDHYLGKEVIQNILAFRFSNPIFEKIWDKMHVDEIQINALESIGIEGRGGYYDGAGALRDMLQSHLMQFLAYITMDQPHDGSEYAVREAKAAVLKNVEPFDRTVPMVLGQYRGYKAENGVKKGSRTETYAAVKLRIDNNRWRDVPIYIRTGKYLAQKETSANIIFRQNTKQFGSGGADDHSNTISIAVSPSAAISIQINVLKSDFSLDTEPAAMHYCRSEQTGKEVIGDYERLLLSIFEGNQQLFTSSDEVLYSWEAIEPFLQKASNISPYPYAKGSEGPTKAKSFLEKDGTSWHHVSTRCPLHP